MELRSDPGELGGPVTTQGLELRAASMGEFKDLDEGKRQVQVVFPHETVDTYRTVFAPGWAEEGWRQSLPLVCWQHDLKEPIGRVINAESLRGRDELIEQFDDPAFVPRAGQAVSQIKSRTLTDQSFGFKNAKYEKAENLGKGVRRILSGYQAEVSPVSIGSIPGAVAVGLREDSTVEEEIIEMGVLLHMRDSGLLVGEAFIEMVERMHPQLAGKITMPVRQDDDETGNGGDDGETDNDDDEDEGLTWTAEDSGAHTATGPNDATATVTPTAEDDNDKHIWVIVGKDGSKLGGGTEDDADSAKKSAEDWFSNRTDITKLDFSDPELIIDANLVRAVLWTYTPALAEELRGAKLTLHPVDDGLPDATSPPPEYVEGMVRSLDEALDQAVQWLEGVDMAGLPDPVQQAVHLVRSADTAADLLLDALGIEDEEEEPTLDGMPRADWEGIEERAAAAGFSTKPWSDITQTDYSPSQWKSACLIVEGDGSTKDQCSFPVKEPDGTYNVNAIAAAAGRLNQSDASPADKESAAKALMSLYGKMKKPVPPGVLKIASGNDRADDGIDTDRLAQEEAEALKKLDSWVPTAG